MSRKRKLSPGSTSWSDTAGLQPVSTTIRQHLCTECATINFKAAIELTPDELRLNENGVLIADLSSRLHEPNRERCDLCSLLVEAVVPHSASPCDLQLRAYSLFRNSSWMIDDPFENFKQYDQPFLALVDKGSDCTRQEFLQSKSLQLYCQPALAKTSQIFEPQVLLPEFDVGFVRNSLDVCRKWHGQLCGLPTSQCKNLRVIDCQTLDIIDASPDYQYIALSYVWSHKVSSSITLEESSTASIAPLSSKSKTIQDAVLVTQRLGFRFLWIDRYCIDQHNLQQKQEQISQMDSIYENAELTIIAIAGTNEDDGLPGAGTTPRLPSQTIKINGTRIIGVPPHPHDSIKSSNWITRGWTFQEGVLSRRRLAFTKEQVYYECNAMNCCESLQPVDLLRLHEATKKKFRRMMHSGVFQARDHQAFEVIDGDLWNDGDQLKRYVHLLEDYSKKNLTYSSDRLNAFLGVLGHLGRARFRLYNAAGVAFLTGMNAESSVSVSSPDRTGFSLSLLWAHSTGPEMICRRAGSPSWSWAGWMSTVAFPWNKHADSIELMRGEVRNFYFESIPDTFIQPRQIVKRSVQAAPLDLQNPFALHLQVLLLPESLKVLSKLESETSSTWSFHECEAIVYPSVEVMTNTDTKRRNVTIECFGDQREWSLALVASYISRRECEDYYLIVISEGDHYTRGGVAVVKCSRAKHQEMYKTLVPANVVLR